MTKDKSIFIKNIYYMLSYRNGNFVFETTHFSDCTVVYEGAATEDPQETVRKLHRKRLWRRLLTAVYKGGLHPLL